MIPNCGCGETLVYYARAHCYLCPTVEREPIAGILNPREDSLVVKAELTALNRAVASNAPVNTRMLDLLKVHICCLPAEVLHEDGDGPQPSQAEASIAYARGLRKDIGRPDAASRDSKGRRQIVDDRGVPVTGISKERFDVYNCEGAEGEECGYRTPSPNAMLDHLRRMNHTAGTTMRGDTVERDPIGS